jgi:hypothetical protein
MFLAPSEARNTESSAARVWDSDLRAALLAL